MTQVLHQLKDCSHLRGLLQPPSPQMTPPRHMLALYQKKSKRKLTTMMASLLPTGRYAGRNSLFLGYHGVTRDRCGHYRSYAKLQRARKRWRLQFSTALRVAADPKARDKGVLVVMNDEIHAAKYVTKTHTTNVSTFRLQPTAH